MKIYAVFYQYEDPEDYDVQGYGRISNYYLSKEKAIQKGKEFAEMDGITFTNVCENSLKKYSFSEMKQKSNKKNPYTNANYLYEVICLTEAILEE